MHPARVIPPTGMGENAVTDDEKERVVTVSREILHWKEIVGVHR